MKNNRTGLQVATSVGGNTNLGGWPSWGAPAPQTPRGARAGDGNNNARGAKHRRGAAEGGARVVVHTPGPPGGSGGREPPRKASPPHLCYAPMLVALFYDRPSGFIIQKKSWET